MPANTSDSACTGTRSRLDRLGVSHCLIGAELPVVLSQSELASVFRGLDGEQRLFAQLLYGTGMRLSEGLQLRVKDIDFAHRAVIVRAGKGGKDRVLMLPQRLEPALREQLTRAHALWTTDQAQGLSVAKSAPCWSSARSLRASSRASLSETSG